MKENARLIYTALYISFLIALFVVFAIVQNIAPGSMSFYIFIFIILCQVSVLFYLIAKKQDPIGEITYIDRPAADMVKENDVSNPTPQENVNDGKEIDLVEIIPEKFANIDKYTEELLQNLAKTFHIVQALLYIKKNNEELYHCYAQYAYFSQEKPSDFKTGETLPGQAVKNKTIVSLHNIPEKYMTIASGLGKSDPKHLVFVPLKNQHNEVVGLIEYATFEPLTENQFTALEGISKKVAETINKQLKSK